jgi:hypothetical protein
VDSKRDPWLAWQVRRAAYVWGTWFDARRNETVERPVPEKRKPTMRVPKYSEGQLRAMLGLATASADTEFGYRVDGGKIVTDREIEGLARDVLAGMWDDEADDPSGGVLPAVHEEGG